MSTACELIKNMGQRRHYTCRGRLFDIPISVLIINITYVLSFSGKNSGEKGDVFRIYNTPVYWNQVRGIIASNWEIMG